MLKQISDLDSSISTGLQEVEVLGEQGQVARALEEYHKVKVAKQEKDNKEKELKQLSDSAGPSGHQKLQVCDVCGAYLSRLDNDRRLADHFYGKVCFIQIQLITPLDANNKLANRCTLGMLRCGPHSKSFRKNLRVVDRPQGITAEADEISVQTIEDTMTGGTTETDPGVTVVVAVGASEAEGAATGAAAEGGEVVMDGAVVMLVAAGMGAEGEGEEPMEVIKDGEMPSLFFVILFQYFIRV